MPRGNKTLKLNTTEHEIYHAREYLDPIPFPEILTFTSRVNIMLSCVDHEISIDFDFFDICQIVQFKFHAQLNVELSMKKVL